MPALSKPGKSKSDGPAEAALWLALIPGFIQLQSVTIPPHQDFHFPPPTLAPSLQVQGVGLGGWQPALMFQETVFGLLAGAGGLGAEGEEVLSPCSDPAARAEVCDLSIFDPFPALWQTKV